MSKEKKRKIIEDKNKEGLVYFEIWGILLILFAIVLLSELGPVGKSLNLLVKILFGDWYWIILIFMFYYGTLMIIYHEFITFSSLKIKGILFVSAGLLINSHFPIYGTLKSSMVSNHTNLISETYNLYMSYINKQLYNYSFGGGVIGAVLFWLSYILLGEIGCRIISIILLISGVAYLFEKTIYEFIDSVYYGIIQIGSNVKKFVKDIFAKMNEVSNLNKMENKSISTESVNVDNNKFENIVLTKNEKINLKQKKYIKPNIKLLNYHDNKNVLENQKEITINNGKIINEFLKNYYLNLEISEIFIGPTISTYIIVVENSIKSKKILNYKEDLVMRLGSKMVRIYDKYDNKHCIVIEVPNKYRYLISLKELLEEETSDSLLPIGRDYCGKICSIDFMKMANILLIGNDITSKIDFLKTIISTILFKFNPDKFKVVLCDSTKYELNCFEDIPHLYYRYISDFQSMKPMLIKLYTETEQRLTNMKYKQNEYIPILVILNDFVDFYINNNEFLKYLNYILVYGSKVGIFTLYATNNLNEKILNNNLKAQFDTIVTFMMNSKEISFKFIEEDATKLLKAGDCLFFSRSKNTTTRVQIASITDEDIIK